VLAQQVMMARLRGVRDDGSETWSMDKWDGYPGERRALLDLLAERGVSNPVVLTGDIHSHWVADLLVDFEDERSPVVATEFVGTSISSGGDGRAMTPGGERIMGLNPHIAFYNGQRGYVVATVTADLWTSDYRIVPFVSEPGAPLETVASFVVESGRAGAQRA
jgi:alkaline phosphatase D